MEARKVRPGNTPILEWVGGHFPVPGVVDDDVEPYHVELVVWFELPSEVVVGHQLVRAGQLDGAFGKSLRDSLQKPLVGPPRRPARVRVESEAAAAEVRGIVGTGIDVVVGAVHEIDAVAKALQANARQSFQDRPGFADFTSGSYLQGGLVPPESIADLFRGARVLNAMAPWKWIRDRPVLRLDIPTLDVHGAAVSILGNDEVRRGLVIFPDQDSFVAMLQDLERKGGEVPDVPGTPMLSLAFLELEELSELARQEIERFGWPEQQSRYPWVDLRERDGSLVPVDRRSIEIVSAVAWTLGTFCIKSEDAITGTSNEPVSMSIDTSRLATVRYTFPYEAYEEFAAHPDPEHRPARRRRAEPRTSRTELRTRRAELRTSPTPAPTRPAARRAKVGRNEPCPCGSGRKYKLCHLQADESGDATPRATVSSGGHVAGVEMIEVMRTFASDYFGGPWDRHVRDFRDAAAAVQLAREWSVFHFEVEGKTAAAAFAAKLGAQLTVLEKQWLAAQEDAWLSVWEVREVDRGTSFTARDLLSGEERTVHDVRASESLAARDAFLGRVVQWRNRSELWGIHPRSLTPLAASHVVDAARKRLRLGSEGLASSQTLHTEATGRFLIRQWESAVERSDEERRNPPRMVTTDGETVVLCSVVYDFDPAQRMNVAAALAGLPHAVPPDASEMQPGLEWPYTFSRVDADPKATARGQERRTVLGMAFLGKSELRLQTNARERCELLTAELAAAAGGLLRQRESSEVDVREQYLKELDSPAASAEPRIPRPEAVPLPEEIALVQSFKRDHYRNWLDESIPALGGRTPRQAARLVRGRRELDLLLRDMENHEGQLPEWDRFDFSPLRTELGLDP